MNKSLRNLKFLARRHKLCGFDADYLDKLSPDELVWFEDFARKYYEGDGETNPLYKREANHRRYMAKKADAMSMSTELTDQHMEHDLDDLTPERLLLLK
jgi:hypothetical protein